MARISSFSQGRGSVPAGGRRAGGEEQDEDGDQDDEIMLI